MSAKTSEIRLVAKHAQVIWIGQLATMAFGVTDAIVAGRHSTEALAGLAVASSLFISIYVSLMGVLQALMPIYAKLHGAGKPRELGAAFRQSIYLGLALMIVGMVLMFQGDALLGLFQVPQNLRPDAVSYLNILALALLPTLGFRMFASLSQSLGEPRIVMRLQMLSLFLKIPLTIWFVLGGLGLPAMGLVGCALASLLVYSLCFFAALWALFMHRVYQDLALFKAWEAPDWRALKNFARLGIPAGLASMIEVTSYALMGLLAARLGVLATASHQIAASVAAVLFMMPLSLSIASSSRVAYWLGAGQISNAHRLARSAYGLTGLIAFCSSLLTAALAHPIASLYSSRPEVAQLGASLILWVAIYHFVDAWQTIGCFLLRCWHISIMPMLVYLVALWGVGLGGGYALTYHGALGWQAWLSPSALWCMGAIAMAMTGLIFQIKVWRISRPTSA